MKRHIYLLTLLAFLLNAFVPFFASYSDVTSKTTSSIFGDKILICTGSGFKLIKLSELDGQQDKNHQSTYKCPLCYIAAHGIKAQPVDLAQQYAVPVFILSDADYVTSIENIAALIRNIPAPIRAPPVPA